MGSDTVAATRSGTKITKLTKPTNRFFQKNLYVVFVAFVIFVSECVPSAVSSSPLPVSPTQGSQATSEWPQFRGNARLTGIAGSALPANLSLKWTYEGGESFESSPAIAGG